MECRFCDIEERQLQFVLESRTHTVVIFSNPRLMPGHLLVIPRRHVEKLSGLPDDERTELLDTTIEYQEKILRDVAPGCDIRQHYRPFVPDNDLKIGHLHMHLHPRTPDDELYEKVEKNMRDVFKSLSQEEFEKYSEIFKD